MQQQLPASIDGATADFATKTISEQSIISIDDERTPRTGSAFRKMLETYVKVFVIVTNSNICSDEILEALLTSSTDFPGFDVVMQYNEDLEQPRRKLDTLPDETIPDLNRAECTKCNKMFSSIW
ncbi:unnamed protein product, partial [Brugia timori]|uniref:NB-ARC domain-containing protein n=1 Tax=Brugia timori TaxID=42155 RepID=A0A0R3QHB7_9BILA